MQPECKYEYFHLFPDINLALISQICLCLVGQLLGPLITSLRTHVYLPYPVTLRT